MKAYPTFLIVLLLFGLLSNCSKSTDKRNAVWYDFNGSATIEVVYSNNAKEQPGSVSAYKMFPEQDIKITDTLKTGSGTLTFHVPTSWPQRITFSAAGKDYKMMLLPGSHLTCQIDFATPDKINFEGPDGLSAVNHYISQKESSGSESFKSRRTMALQSSPDLETFSKTIDAIHTQELHFFDQYKNTLPDWFLNYEYWDIRYGDAMLRLHSIPQRAYAGKVNEKIPEKYFDFLKTTKVDNQSARNSISYYLFLYELFNKGLNDKSFVNCPQKDFLNYHLCRADHELSGEVKDMFKAYTIQNVYNYYKRDVAMDYLKSAGPVFSDTVWKQQLQTYFQDKENTIAKDQLAPNFVLADLQDSLTSLRSFKGNIVVLSFWFSGCKPCIEEFPAENSLVAHFKDKPVKIVNVCVNTTEEQWRQASRKFKLNTINLWANPEWQKTIIEKYDLYGFPRYVLIDQHQKIANSNANRPRLDLEKQITELLNK